MLGTTTAIIGIIVGIFTIIGGLYAFFTRTNIGIGYWSCLTAAFWRFVSFIWLHRKKTLFIILLLILGFVAYRLWGLSRTKSITGNIYYLPCEGSMGRDPVPNVTVFLSERRELKSEPTALDGKFVISGVPADANVIHLTAHHGGQDYPPVDYKATGDYAIISPECEKSPDIREIDTPWEKVSAEGCLPEKDVAVNIKRRYLLKAFLPAVQGKREALLTVKLKDPANAMILNAFVLAPSEELALYTNAMQGMNKKATHRWLFILPKEGLRIELEVCLGSNESSAALSQEQIHTYYKLQ